MNENNDKFFPENTIITSKLSCGKSIIELSEFDNIALWWFADYEFKTVYKSLINGAENTIIQKSITEKLPAFVKGQMNVPLFFFKNLIKIFCNMMLISINPQRNDVEKPKILFTGQDIEWRQKYNANGGLERYEHFFNDIIKNIQKKNNYILVSFYPFNIMSIRSHSIFIDKLLHWEIKHLPFDSFYDYFCYKKRNDASWHFKKIWETLDHDPVFEKLLCKYSNDNPIPLKRYLKKCFLDKFPGSIEQIQIAINLIQREKPSLLLLQNEYGSFELASLIAARIQGVPTLAIQHGIVDPSVPAYFHGKLKDPELRYLEYPIPDITAVYGFYEYNLLIANSNYLEENVVITGSQRYDQFPSFDHISLKNDFFIKYGINSNNKIILWTTQSHALLYNENFINYDTVFNAINGINNVLLIIKPHPGEGTKYLKMIEFFKNRYPIQCIVETSNANTDELLSICDLLVTKHSMTGLEAIALNKPVIVLNLSGFPDVGDYVKEGVASGVYNKDDLKPIMEQLLTDASDLERKRPNYIKNHLLAVDGKATERIINVIEDLINN